MAWCDFTMYRHSFLSKTAKLKLPVGRTTAVVECTSTLNGLFYRARN